MATILRYLDDSYDMIPNLLKLDCALISLNNRYVIAFEI